MLVHADDDAIVAKTQSSEKRGPEKRGPRAAARITSSGDTSRFARELTQ
jgi:hypothetical protein